MLKGGAGFTIMKGKLWKRFHPQQFDCLSFKKQQLQDALLSQIERISNVIAPERLSFAKGCPMKHWQCFFEKLQNLRRFGGLKMQKCFILSTLKILLTRQTRFLIVCKYIMLEIVLFGRYNI